MARVASNEITITDISDGTNPIIAFTTNANHTFAASANGTVSNIIGFSSTLVVFVGQTQASYVSTIGSTPNTFSITAMDYVDTTGVISPTGWGTPSNNNGTVTIQSISATAALSTTLRLTFSVVPTSTTTPVTGLTQDITLSVVKEGAGGQVFQITPSSQTFFANSSGTLNASQPNSILGIESQGTTGNITLATSINGAAFITQTATSTAQGGIAFYDADTSGTVSTTGTFPVTQNGIARLAIAQTNLGNTGSTLTVKITGATGGSDAITIFKVEEGAPGTGAIIVSVTSSDGVVFKNSAGTVKTLTANVIDVDTGAAPTTVITYTWTRAALAQVHVTSQTDRTVIASGGVVASGTGFPDIKVGAEDVLTQERFGASVSVADS
tara:strand:- start:847 stop:1995 length:1149 start_codon:yes stop_codon:yes gene_type:complete